MSLFCLCVVEDIKERNKILFYTQQLMALAKRYKRGIKFFVDWSEPIVSRIKKDSLVINVLDCPESDNCEMFLLPNGWYSNGETNELTFRERIKFLQDISNVFIKSQYSIDIYLGNSGTHANEFFNITLKSCNLIDYLTKTVGLNGVNNGIHISVTP